MLITSCATIQMISRHHNYYSQIVLTKQRKNNYNLNLPITGLKTIATFLKFPSDLVSWRAGSELLWSKLHTIFQLVFLLNEHAFLRHSSPAGRQEVGRASGVREQPAAAHVKAGQRGLRYPERCHAGSQHRRGTLHDRCLPQYSTSGRPLL